MKAFVFRVFIGVVLLFILLIFADKRYTKLIRKNENDKVRWMMNIHDQHFDYAVIGSSRAETGIDIKVLDSVLGLNGINIANNGAGLIENELSLLLFLKRNKINKLIIGVDDANLSPGYHFSNPFHEHVFYAYWPGNACIDSFIKKRNSLLSYTIKSYVPFVRYIEYNSYYFSQWLTNDSSGFDKHGFRPYINHQKEYTFIDGAGNFVDTRYWYIAPYLDPKGPFENIDTTSLHSLHRMVQLCKKKNIELVLYNAPYFKEHYSKCMYNTLSKDDFLKEYATKNNILYISFIQWKHSDNATLFYDYSHINNQGAFLVCTDSVWLRINK